MQPFTVMILLAIMAINSFVLRYILAGFFTKTYSLLCGRFIHIVLSEYLLFWLISGIANCVMWVFMSRFVNPLIFDDTAVLILIYLSFFSSTKFHHTINYIDLSTDKKLNFIIKCSFRINIWVILAGDNSILMEINFDNISHYWHILQ